MIQVYMEVSYSQGYLIGGPHNQDHSILGSILGSPCFGKLPQTIPQSRLTSLGYWDLYRGCLESEGDDSLWGYLCSHAT